MSDVLFVTTSDLSGSSGNNVATTETIAAFARSSTCDVSVVCPAPVNEMPRKVDQRISEFHFVTPREEKSIKNHLELQLGLLFKIGSLLRREPFDLLVIRHAPVMIAPTVLAVLLGVPFVLLARGLAHERLRYSSLLRGIFRFNVRMADDVYCAYSEVVDRAAEIRSGSASAPVLFTNAVDPDEFDRYGRNDARERLGQEYDQSDFVVGFVGSLKPYHTLKKMILAIDSLDEDTQLLVLGDGPERESLNRLVANLGLCDRVTLAGFVEHDRIDEYIAACDVAYGVIDPEHPGNAIKCYEYLACGRPVITDRRSEFEFVDEVGAGVVIDQVTVDKIEDAIRELKSMPLRDRLEMGERGREHVLENHTWDALVELVADRNL